MLKAKRVSKDGMPEHKKSAKKATRVTCQGAVNGCQESVASASRGTLQSTTNQRLRYVIASRGRLEREPIDSIEIVAVGPKGTASLRLCIAVADT
jgi:hypothetical protein